MTRNLTLLFFIVFAAGITLTSHAQLSTTQIITTIAGSGTVGYSGNGGPATDARLDSPSCLAMDALGNLYVNDQRNSSIRKISPSGIMTTVAGTGVSGYNGDGIRADTAQLNVNWGIATDHSGNIYLTDQLNYRVREVSAAGIISTIAGTGTAGFKGDNGPAVNARFQGTMGIAVDGSGNVYVGDQNNFRIRKINSAGIVTTVAGTGKYGISGNNIPATSATLTYVFGMVTDAAGNLYFCDAASHRIRKIDGSGTVTTVAGNGTGGFAGDGGPATNAQLNYPLGIYVHSSGTLYIADYLNNRIRKVDPAGIISTIVGTGIQGFNGDDIPATASELFHPISVTMDVSDNIYITDLDNVRIRQVRNAKTLSFTGGRYQHIIACENKGATPANSLLAIIDYEKGLTDTWDLLSPPAHGTIATTFSHTASGFKNTPSGFSYTPDGGYLGNDTFTARVSNGVLSDTTTVYVTVSTLPSAGTLSGNPRVCIESLDIISSTANGGIWTVTNPNATINGGSVTGVYAGMDTIIYTVTNTCGTDIAKMAITVDPLPDAGEITGPASLCNGTTVTLSDYMEGGVWSCSNGFATVNNGVVRGVTAGEVVIKYTVTDSFCSATALHNLKIDKFPDPGTITGLQNVCKGESIILEHSVSGGEWKTTNGFATITASGSVTGVTEGVDTIGYSIINSCGEATATAPVTVNPLPQVPVLLLSEDTCSAPAGYAQYQWTFNNIPIPGAVTDTYNLTNKGNYAVIVTNDKGCSVSSQPIFFSGCDVNDINIFPNPSEAVIYIRWCKRITVKLNCMDGREVRTFEKANRIDFGDLPNGMYVLTLYDSEGKKLTTRRVTKVTK